MNQLVNKKDNLVLVSVIVPVYNRISELERAIRSVLAQSVEDFEVIIVDDGSNFDVKTVCDSFKDDRIRYLRNDVHKNANIARNRGMSEAKGEYIAMLDSDDEFLPTHLERRLTKIKEWDCDGIFGSAYVDDGVTRELFLSRPRRGGELMINYLLSDGFAQTSSHFYRREVAMEVPWDETMDRHQDFDFTVRFSDRYSFLSDYEPTVVVNWVLGRKRNLKYDSCIEFINRHKEKISGRVYNFYHRSMYKHVQGNITVDKRIEKHYSTNSYKYIYAVPFSEFLFVHKVKKILYVFVFIKFILLHVLFFGKVIFFKDMLRETTGGGYF